VKWTGLRIVLILAPLASLGIDLAMFPTVFESRSVTRELNINSLLVRQALPLGTFRGHNIHVSLDNIADERFLDGLHQSGNALAISIFVDRDEGVLNVASLGGATLKRLNALAPSEARKLERAFTSLERGKPGAVAEAVLELSPEQYRRFPVRHIYAVLLPRGESKAAEDDVARGVAQLVAMAEVRRVDALVLPCLGYNWQDKDSISFDRCFEPIFAVLRNASYPQDVYLSLYSEWPTFELEQAASAINRIWGAQAETSDRSVPLLNRGALRVTFLMLALCLLVCSMIVALTLRSFLIIASVFLGMAAAAAAAIDTFLTGYDAALRFWVNAAALLIVALGLPSLVHWDPKDIFKKGRR